MLGRCTCLANHNTNCFRVNRWHCFVFRITSQIYHLQSNMADYTPGLSQVKSIIQFCCGDTKGAKKTQDNFTQVCPIISQLRAVGEYFLGRREEAVDTLIGGSKFIDTIPVAGHAKGVYHYACGDKESGDAAMIAASRTTGVTAGAVGGFALGGPPGAAAGAVAAGTFMDSVTTMVDSTVHGEIRAHGHYAIAKEISDDPTNPWNYFDLLALPITDATAGYSTGKCIAKAKPGATPMKAIKHVVKDSHETFKVMNKATAIEDRVTRYERNTRSPNNDDDDSEIYEAVATVRKTCGFIKSLKG